MRVILQLDDDAYDAALKLLGSKSAVERQLVRAWDAFAEVAADDRAFVVHGKQRQAIEKVVQTTVASAGDIVRHLSNMSKVKIGSVERLFTADELIRLETQAKFHGWTPEKFLELTSDEAIRYALDRI